jgi:predicted nuclease of restriction endonuclease-like RecB superfamily
MLTGKLVRVRQVRNRLVPQYLDPADPRWLDVAEQLLVVYRDAPGRTRGELAAEVAELTGDGPGALVPQGLAKLLEDRCETDVVSDLPPEQVREAVFLAAAGRHAAATLAGEPFDRDAVLAEVAKELKLTPRDIDRALFADLWDEQRITRFDDITPERLHDRYNESLAQAVLVRSTGMEVRVWDESPARFRQLFRAMKFRRLIGTIRPADGNSFMIQLDGPLSLFSSTQKYGLQLALFLPAILHCRAFQLRAEVLWGAQRKAKVFELSAADGLRSHLPDFGVHTPREIENLTASFRSSVADWLLTDEPNPIPVEDTIWVPDFTLTHTGTGRQVHVEVLGFWRRVAIEAHYRRLKRALPGQFVLVISEQYRADEADEFATGDGVYRFKRTPVAAEVARVAAAVAGIDAGPRPRSRRKGKPGE